MCVWWRFAALEFGGAADNLQSPAPNPKSPMDQTTIPGKPPRFVVCVKNDGYTLDLALQKRYEVLPDPSAERSGWIRIVDETGEDYLYPESLFQPLEKR